MPVTTYQQALDWLYSFVLFDKQRRAAGSGDLGRMEQLLARMGSPQSRFPSVLIAGTKGKGSTAEMLASILSAAGYRTGLYTSPHLHTFRERIRVDDRLITREEIISGVRRLEELVKNFPDVIWFELVTALAFEFFASQGVEIAVLEVGLGGRLDPTNVVHPLVSVITPISYDHMEVLGNTLTDIAREKAGIIKPETPVVSGPQEAEAWSVIEASARANKATLVEAGREWNWVPIAQDLHGQSLAVRGPDAKQLEVFLPLLGPHQQANAVTVIATLAELEKQGWLLPEQTIGLGMANVAWPVRLEVLSREPLILADGAHNRASAHALRSALSALRPGAPVHLIFGASNDKDIAGMFAELVPGAASLILTHSSHVRASDPQALARLASTYGVPTFIPDGVQAALDLARSRARPGEVICVTGSLFVAAEARGLVLAEGGIAVETDEN